MGEYTINKIQIYKADPKKWQAILREKIPVDILPKHFGGDAVDPDGNPRCVTKVCQYVMHTTIFKMATTYYY